MRDDALNESEDVLAECEFGRDVMGKCLRSGARSPATSCYPYIVN